MWAAGLAIACYQARDEAREAHYGLSTLIEMTRSVVRLPTLQHSPRTTTRLASSVCGLMLGAWARCESVMTHSPRTLVESFSSMTKRSSKGRIHQCEAGVRMTTTCPGSRFIRSNVSVTTRPRGLLEPLRIRSPFRRPASRSARSSRLRWWRVPGWAGRTGPVARARRPSRFAAPREVFR